MWQGRSTEHPWNSAFPLEAGARLFTRAGRSITFFHSCLDAYVFISCPFPWQGRKLS